MTIREKLQKAWENRNQIVEGFYNAYISGNKEIQAEIQRRVTICRTNVCGHHDPEGKGDNVILKGEPACGICGCHDLAKAGCMSCVCTLQDIGEKPLWEPLLSQEQEDELSAIAAEKRRLYEERQKQKKTTKQ